MKRPAWLSRRTAAVSGPVDTSGVPEWVTQFRRWGVPAAAVFVLVLCAPGERYLADLVGWSQRMSWGLAGLFTLYAGLASVISTQLPRGARGKISSIFGAAISLALAMGAQPVAHMFATGYLDAEPRPPLWLVISVSSVPPLVLGHLLHFAAMPPSVRPVVQPDMSGVPDATVTRLRPRPVRVPRPAPVRPVLSAGQAPGQIAPRLSLSARALVLAQDGLDKDTIKDKLKDEFPDAKADSVRKAADRAADKVSGRP